MSTIPSFDLVCMGWVLIGREEGWAADVKANILGIEEELDWDDEGREHNGGSGTQELNTIEWRISKGKESVEVDKWEVEEDGKVEEELGKVELIENQLDSEIVVEKGTLALVRLDLSAKGKALSLNKA